MTKRVAITNGRPTFDLERQFSGLVAGVDEAGRGPWAGPVVAAAVILNPSCTPSGLNDSKKLSARLRDELFEAVMKTARVGVGAASVEEIDRLNIHQATLAAMRRAVLALPAKPTALLVDGKFKPMVDCAALAVVKGDAKSLSIAAASIVAKVTRDRLMIDLAQEFPGYGWDSNKGYGAPAHKKALADLGVTPHHRRSFAPIHNMLYAPDSQTQHQDSLLTS